MGEKKHNLSGPINSVFQVILHSATATMSSKYTVKNGDFK